MSAERPFPPALWEQISVAVQDYIRALEARVTALEAIVQRLEVTVQHMTEGLQQDSRTSSRPPSSNLPQATAKRARRAPSGRRPGGQTRHEGHTRALVPVDAVAMVCPVKPARCRHCQHPLLGEDPTPRRHQVTDRPPVLPVVTAYQLHQLRCPVCGEVTPAEWPTGVSTGGFGPRAQVIVPLCTGPIICPSAPPSACAKQCCTRCLRSSTSAQAAAHSQGGDPTRGLVDAASSQRLGGASVSTHSPRASCGR